VYLVRIEDISPPAVETAVDASDQLSFAEGQAMTETDTFVQCNVVVAEPTPESRRAEQAVHVGRSRVESGSKTIAVQLSEQDTASTVAETLKTTYDDVVVSSVRQDHQTTSLGTVGSLLEPLTDKQYTAIEHAYYGGFFEHPRDTTATELADQFDVTRQTITHHLRAAERKLLDQLFDQ
jgi:predicted DNA binding protein